MIKNLRWYIVGLLALLTAINYLDRNALSIAQTVLEDEFGMTNRDYGHIVSLFLIAYGVMHPFAGRIIDKLNTRRGLSLALIWWSLAGIGHAFVSSVAGFGFARFFLGIGESGNFPGAIKTVGEWFPPKERAMATGIFNVGAGLGAIIAPPLVGYLILRFGWRAAFIATGTLGFLWLIPWLKLSQKPEQNKRITPEELNYIRSGQEECEENDGKQMSLLNALGQRDLWALMMARFMSDSAWFFFAFWIPKYFKDARGFDLKQIAMFVWLPFVAADIGSVVGGALSSLLIKRGVSVIKARKLALCSCALLMPVAILTVHAQSWQLAIVCLGVATFAHQAWAASVLTLPADLFPKSIVATTYGLTACMGTLGGVLTQWLVGGVIDTVGYVPVFTVIGFLHPIAAMIIILLVSQKITTIKSSVA
ncbi:MAG: MFS transporter [Armatimonadota bacterium]|nr:MFS transporter [bacterium]